MLTICGGNINIFFRLEGYIRQWPSQNRNTTTDNTCK